MPTRILVIQTAFIGDVILTIPLLQVLKRSYPEASVDCVVVPRAAGLLKTHPSVDRVVEYDKRGRDRGIGGFLRLLRLLRPRRYDIAVVPHRSLRSAVLARGAGIRRRIGFDRSAGSMFWTDTVRYAEGVHEIDRNLALLKPLGIEQPAHERPFVYSSPEDIAEVDRELKGFPDLGSRTFVAVAPGTIWKTKQWLPEYVAEICRLMARAEIGVILIGGPEDAELCERIRAGASSAGVVSTAGTLTLRQSAELLRRCAVLVCNDSAPMHIAGAVGTPVVAIFGATVPAFGFSPRGPRDVVMQIEGLRCRPCSIHGGPECPIKTFDCMVRIRPSMVYAAVQRMLPAPPR